MPGLRFWSNPTNATDDPPADDTPNVENNPFPPGILVEVSAILLRVEPIRSNTPEALANSPVNDMFTPPSEERFPTDVKRDVVPATIVFWSSSVLRTPPLFL